MTEQKAWWQSKTIWMNFILLAVAILGVFSDYQVIDPKLVAIISSILNVVLRFVTTEPIR